MTCGLRASNVWRRPAGHACRTIAWLTACVHGRCAHAGVSLGGMHAWLTACVDERITVTAPMIGVQVWVTAAAAAAAAAAALCVPATGASA